MGVMNVRWTLKQLCVAAENEKYRVTNITIFDIHDVIFNMETPKKDRAFAISF